MTKSTRVPQKMQSWLTQMDTPVYQAGGAADNKFLIELRRGSRVLSRSCDVKVVVAHSSRFLA